MLKTLALVFPVLFPSWRFFKTIEPSPRVEWAPFFASGAHPIKWRAFRPSPPTLSLLQMLVRLVWNPERNEELFIISCAERIQAEPTDHSINVIKRFIQSDMARLGREHPSNLLQFRLVFVHRKQTRLLRDIVFTSDPFPTTPQATY